MLTSLNKGHKISNSITATPHSSPSRHLVIVGKNSRLTQALIRAANSKQFSTTVIATSDCLYSSRLEDALDTLKDEGTSLFLSSAITNPQGDIGQIRAVNVFLPDSVARMLLERGGEIKLVTFGSALETKVRNPYFDSKVQMLDRLSPLLDSGLRHLHVRTHTLFGQQPPPEHSLLGQLVQAIRSRTSLEMSNGRQFRKYLTFDSFVHLLLDLDSKLSGKVQIGTNAAIQIGELINLLLQDYPEVPRPVRGTFGLQIGEPTDSNLVSSIQDDVVVDEDWQALMRSFLKGWL